MDDVRRPQIRALGWVGTWAGTFLLFLGLTLWSQFFHPHQRAALPPLGTARFWEIIGGFALLASMSCLSLWRNAKKPTRRAVNPPPATPGDYYKRGGAAVVLVVLVIAQAMASNPGVSPNWFGVLGGAAVLAGLFAGTMACAKLAWPNSAEAAVVIASSPVVATIRAPKNRYRAEATLREVVYRRPLYEWITTAIMALLFAAMIAFLLWVEGISLHILPGSSGFTPAPGVAVVTLPGIALFGALVFTLLGFTGPDELRVSPRDGTYVYCTGGPPQSALAKAAVAFFMREEVLRDGLRLPWRVESFTGSAGDMAGVEIRAYQGKQAVHYFLALRWTLPGRPPMRLGHALTETDALALQAQAAEDLGAPSLPRPF